MSFNDLEEKMKKIKGQKDVTPEVDRKKGVTDLLDPETPTKTARAAGPQGLGDDLFDNVPV
ncbi:hypothetical protein CLV80_101399 [Yoonia maritima]|uniref:Uncharacterized protein n=1 Tax=Yoonia maritima TaxID=1435347 RepID=A0A2T0W4Y3_9RHOB|nr:hypothetical protein [Yoonia maritima]PRY80544.1 hypothetical protein CLV80_101399 [Yoonia maritima]